ncbi:MAG TPA: hypothetical protein VFQ45_00945 [Longimicrobium sp.]|nr:hypothetical protein [Longimicrobium sp.]
MAPARRAKRADARLTPAQRRLFERLPRATRLSPEGTREILEEMLSPPADTPERRATLAGARLWQERREAQALSDLTGLSRDAALHALHALNRLPPGSPARRAVLKRALDAEQRSERVPARQ